MPTKDRFGNLCGRGLHRRETVWQRQERMRPTKMTALVASWARAFSSRRAVLPSFRDWKAREKYHLLPLDCFRQAEHLADSGAFAPLTWALFPYRMPRARMRDCAKGRDWKAVFQSMHSHRLGEKNWKKSHS